jgi:hypothetical protein
MRTKQDHQVRSEIRAQQQLENDVARFLLKSVGCSHLYNELSWECDQRTCESTIWIKDIFEHVDFDPYVMKLAFSYRECKRPERGIEKLLGEWADSFLDRFREQSYGVIMPWHEEVVVLHNRPFWSQYTAIDALEIDEDCTLALHWFQPFICELAEQCRCDMADEDTITELLEGEEWSRDWYDYPRPRFAR